MPKSANQKLKLLYLMQYLLRETDESHGVTVEDMIRYLLWSEEEDSDKKRTYVRNIIYDIRSTFSAAGIEDVVISRQGNYCVNTQKIRCDYYDWLDGKPVRTAMLHEYMEQFSSWSAATKQAIFPEFQ